MRPVSFWSKLVSAFLGIEESEHRRRAQGRKLAFESLETRAMFDGMPLVSITALDGLAAEQAQDTGVYRIHRDTSDNSSALTVNVQFSGTAGGSDYAALSAYDNSSVTSSVVIPAGFDIVDVILTPIDDSEFDEGDETAVLTLLSSGGGCCCCCCGSGGSGATYTVGSPSQATVTIADNDITPAAPEITIAVTDAVAGEQGSNSGEFTLYRTGPTDSSLTVNVGIAGAAAHTGANSDYSANPAFPSGSTTTVTFVAGSSTATIVITPVDDTEVEGNEDVVLSVLSSSGGGGCCCCCGSGGSGSTYTVGSTSQATLTITDNDVTPSAPEITIAATDAVAGEQGQDTGEFTLYRTGPTSSSLTVNLGISGSASNAGVNLDYVATPSFPSGSTTIVTFAANSSTATIVITPEDDDEVEEDEDVVLTILLDSGGGSGSSGSSYTIGSLSQATISITDNDLPEITIAATDAEAAEEGQETGTFTLYRTGPLTNSLDVQVEITGAAIHTGAGLDYTAVAPFPSGSTTIVTFAAGSSTATVVITPEDDDEVEEDEDVVLTISSNSSDYTVGSANEATVTITDNDAPEISVTAADAKERNEVPGEFKFTRTGPTTEALTVTYVVQVPAAAGMGPVEAIALKNIDYYAELTGTIEFAVGQAEAVVSLHPIDDKLKESSEKVVVTINPSSSEQYVLGALSVATLTIEDDDFDIPKECPECCGCETGNVTTGTTTDLGSVVIDVTVGLFGIVIRNVTASNPHPIVTVDYTLDPDSDVPDLVEAQLTFGGITGTSVFYDPSALAAGESMRIALQADATELASGRYDWQMVVKTHNSGDTRQQVYSGSQSIVNDAESRVGNRWSISGVDRLVVSEEGATLIRSGSFTDFFKSDGEGGFEREDGEAGFSTLTQNVDGSYTLSSKDRTSCEFNAEGLLTSCVDTNGNVTTYAYVGTQLAQITDASRRTTTFAYTDDLLSTVTDDIGRVTTLVHDGDKLVSVQMPDPDGAGPLSQVSTFEYDPTSGLVTKMTDATGRSTEYTYDHAKRIQVVTLPCGCPEEIDPLQSRTVVDMGAGLGTMANPAPAVKSGDATQARRKDTQGNEKFYELDRFGNTTSFVDGEGNVTLYTRDKNGQVSKITSADPDGLGPLTSTVTLFAYDALGNLLIRINPDESVETWTYDAIYSRVTSYTDGLGHQTLNTIDGRGNLLTERRVVGEVDSIANGETNDVVTSYTYTPAPTATSDPPGGLLASMTDALGRVTEYEYNKHGDPTRVTYAVGTSDESFVEFEYDLAGNQTASIDELGRRTEYEYDVLNRLTKTILPDPDTSDANPAPEIAYEYDAVNRLTKTTDQLGRVTTYAYEDFGRRTVITQPDHDGNGVPTVTISQRDSEGKLRSMTDALGRVTTYDYDANNRLTTTTLPDPDGAGPLTSPVMTNVYDGMGRLVSVIGPAPEANAAPTVASAVGTVTSAQTDPQSTVDLHAVFADAEDADIALRYTLVSNSNPDLFKSILILPTGSLVLSYAAGAGGTATIVVRATDTQGQSVEETFYVDRTAANSDVTVDDGEAGYAETGTWADSGLGGIAGDSRYSADAAATSTFSFSNLVQGWQEVFVSTPGHANSTSAAKYTIASGSTILGEVTIDQRPGTSGWLSLGKYQNAGTSLTVTVSNDSSGNLRADAVRVTTATAPTSGSHTIDNGEAHYAEILGNWFADSSLGGVDGDSRYASNSNAKAVYSFTNLSSGWTEIRVNTPAHVNSTDRAVYTISSGGEVLGEVPIDQRSGTGGWMSLGSFFVAGSSMQVTVSNSGTGNLRTDAVEVLAGSAPTAQSLAIDDGSVYYADSGWATGGLSGGYQSDYRYANAGAGSSKASWTFVNLLDGEYEVQVTWVNHPNRAIDAPYSVFDGLTLLGNQDINQVIPPAGSTFGSVSWRSLGNFTVESGVIRVELTNGASGVVIADGVRIIPVNTVPAGEPPAEASPEPFRVLSASPGENVLGPVDQILVTFSEAVASGTFTLADVTSLSDPGGAITATAVTQVSRTQYAVQFASQSMTGSYTLVLGPGIVSTGGSLLDQDRDGAPGEADDMFTDDFHIAASGYTGAPTTTYEYDENNRVVATVDALGNSATSEYDAAGRLVATTDGLGRVTTYTYDELDRLIAVTSPDPDGAGSLTSPVTQYEYDKVGNQRFMTDALGNVTEYVYDARNRLVQTVAADPDGGGPQTSPVTTMIYDDAGQLTSVIDPLGRTTSYVYDGLGRQVQITQPDPDGGGSQTAPITYSKYDDVGNLIETTNALGHVTTYKYDALNNQIKVTEADPDGPDSLTSPVTIYTYDDAGKMLSMTDPLGRVTSYSFDSLGRMIEIVRPDPDGTGPLVAPVSTFAYDPAGNPIRGTDANGNVTQYVYDALYRQIASISSVGGVSSSTFDAAGQIISTTDELARTTSFDYDQLGRLVTVTEPDPDGAGSQLAPQMTYIYDAVGNKLSETDREGHESTFDYDELYRLESQTNPNNETTSYTYDLVGNLTSLTDPVSNTTRREYDGLNRMTDETNELNQTSAYVYDAHGRLIEKTDRLGRVTQYEFDALDRQIEERWLTGVTVVNTIHYAYDDAGQVIEAGDDNATYSYVYDDQGRVTEITQDLAALGKTVVMAQEYDSEGNRTLLSVSVDGTSDFTNGYTYDSFDRLASLTQTGTSGGATVADKRVDFTYFKDGRFNSITRYADLVGTDLVATTDYGYDSNGQLTSLVHREGATILAGYEYEFDAVGRMTAWTNLLYSAESATFDYDDAGQLTGADRDGTASDETYDYDDNGNRESANGSTYTAADNNQLESDGTYAYEYDAVGNRLRRTRISDGTVTEYGWDFRNRLILVTNRISLGGTATMVAEYSYDLHGRRLSKTVDADGDGVGLAASEFYVYDGSHVVAVYNAAGALEHRYLHGNKLDQIFADEQFLSNVTAWALVDHLGSVRDIATSDVSITAIANHRSFDAFGRFLSESNPSISLVFAFTGREYDQETLLYNLRSRYYDPVLGRFLSEDPAGLEIDPNLLAYVSNCPTTITDPFGLFGLFQSPALNNNVVGSLLGSDTPRFLYDYARGSNRPSLTSSEWRGAGRYYENGHAIELNYRYLDAIENTPTTGLTQSAASAVGLLFNELFHHWYATQGRSANSCCWFRRLMKSEGYFNDAMIEEAISENVEAIMNVLLQQKLGRELNAGTAMRRRYLAPGVAGYTIPTGFSSNIAVLGPLHYAQGESFNDYVTLRPGNPTPEEPGSWMANPGSTTVIRVISRRISVHTYRGPTEPISSTMWMATLWLMENGCVDPTLWSGAGPSACELDDTAFRSSVDTALSTWFQNRWSASRPAGRATVGRTGNRLSN